MALDTQTASDILDCTNNQQRFNRFQRETQTVGYCQHPVTLSDGKRTILKGCGNRRSSVCLPCSDRYKNDMWHLVSAGLRGGKGVPDTVAGHPMVFVTLTAPSFGAVHSTRDKNTQSRVCRPNTGRCPHGRPKGCWQHHTAGEECLGKPLCLKCFRYQQAVTFNLLAPELWRRTTIYIKRALAQVNGIPQHSLNKQVRLSYVKVAEYQKRGVIHFHAIIRLDGIETDEVTFPPEGFTTGQLIQAVRLGVQTVAVPSPLTGNELVRWGTQLDIQPITQQKTLSKKAAAYIAKYATKATETIGVPTHRINENQIDHLVVHPHIKRYLQTTANLANRKVFKKTSLHRVIQTLGFRGHCTTKSRRYSTTLTRLRTARKTYKHTTTPKHTTQNTWVYTGHKQFTTGEQLLITTAYQTLQEQHKIARQEQRAIDKEHYQCNIF